MARYLPARIDRKADPLARGLGWFTIAQGIVQIAAAGVLPGLLGTRGKDEKTSAHVAYGIRKIGAGIGILGSDDPMPWIWGSAIGDALDVKRLAPAVRRDNPKRRNARLALGLVSGALAVNLLCALALADRRR